MTATIEAEVRRAASHEFRVAVLIVDDSAMDRRTIASLLESGFNARILTAVNGIEGLKVLRREEPALVLTDMQMPELDGLQLVEEIRSNYPQLPVVLMTAHGSEELAMRALQAGAASYVPKRLAGTELIPTIEQILLSARQERRKGRVLECLKRMESEYVLDNDPAIVPAFISQLQEQMVRMRICNENGKIRIGVALEESLLNGMYHGNLELSSDLRQDGSNRFNELAEERRFQDPYRNRRLWVRTKLTPEEATFVIRDEGPGFDVSKLPDPTDPENMLRASGRGLLLIRTFMDQVSHNATGNEITLTKRALR